MKRFIYIIMLAAFTACTNDTDQIIAVSTVKMTFTISGDFQLTTHDFTRALTADGKDMTDVWVLDYVNGELKQQMHQSSGDADFGQPTLNLAIGEHHIYFVASRGASPTLDTDAHTLIFASVRDTFWKDYALNISYGTMSGSRNVTLDRLVTKLKVTFSDAIPSGAATFNITPEAWHYGIDYTTGEPISSTPSQAITVNIPSSIIGVAGESVSIFGFSSATEWQTDITINCKTNDNTILGSATISNAPFIRNRVSEYTGPLFGDNGYMTLSLNTEWSTTHTGTW